MNPSLHATAHLHLASPEYFAGTPHSPNQQAWYIVARPRSGDPRDSPLMGSSKAAHPDYGCQPCGCALIGTIIVGRPQPAGAPMRSGSRITLDARMWLAGFRVDRRRSGDSPYTGFRLQWKTARECVPAAGGFSFIFLPCGAESKSWERPRSGHASGVGDGAAQAGPAPGSLPALPDPAVDPVSRRNCYERHDFASLQA
jgi:hypothetical protein